MEQESGKERKPANRLTSERFRLFVYFVAIACVLTSIVVLFVSLASIERRFQSKLDEISKEMKTIRSEIDAEKLLSSERHKRNINPSTSLSDLTNRLIALEGR